MTGRCDAAARAGVERPTVPGAGDDAVFEFAFGQHRAFVRAYLDGDGIGSELPLGSGDADRSTIAGVIEDVQPLTRGEPPRPEIYVSYLQFAGGMRFDEPMLVARTDRNPAELVPYVRRAVADLHPGVHLDSIMTMEDRLMTSLARPRLYAVLLGGFAGLAATPPLARSCRRRDCGRSASLRKAPRPRA